MKTEPQSEEQQRLDQVAASKAETERLLDLARESRRALLSVLEDERLAGQQLRESEERFRQLAENIQEVFWITGTPKDRMLYISPGYERIWGRPCAELYACPQSWLDAIHPEDRERVRQASATRQAAGTYDEHYRIIRPDGSVRWICDRAFPVKDAAGTVIRCVGVARDVTEHKEAEEALRASERRFREMLENVGLISMTLDKKGIVTFCNDYLLNLTGWKREEVIGADWFTKFIPGQDDAKAIFFDTIETGAFPAHHENPIHTRDGRLRDIVWNNTLLRDPSGALIGTASIGEDVTERNLAVARVREQAEMLDHAHDAIIVRGIHDRLITFWNRGAELLYGWTAEEALGRESRELVFVDPDTPDVVSERLIETGEWDGEIKQVTKDGRQLIVSTHATLVRDARGLPKSALVINFDITAQKSLEEQFLRAQRMESIGTLASGVAHDLNNILAPILMAAPLLRGELSAEFREKIVTTIETSAQRGADIVKQVLTFARGVDGERVLVQPVHLLHEMARIVQETFPKNIAVRPRYSSGAWAVKGDPTQLHQVFLNLCVNARDAMPNGGELVLGVENFNVDEHFAAMTPGAEPGPHVLITVGDTGEGMSREVMAKIFDPFFTTKETGKGTGLGLSTVIGIVKSHGGFLTVESEPGRGTTFKIYLPTTDSAAAAAPASVVETSPPGHGELVLVVDDEANIRKISQTILEKNGYRVITAADGPEALALFARHMAEFKAVLADVMMPVMDGAVLARVLQRMSPQTPVIACSGQWEESRERELKEAGVKLFLRKPYNTAKLLTALRSVLESV